MPAYELTADAEKDLVDIIEYTVNNHGIAQAREYVAQLETCALNLASRQGYYRELKNVHPRLRVTRCQHHYIFGIVPTGYYIS